MTHDFKKNPELTNSQMETMYFSSPHRQITEGFEATVTKVVDGDTIKVMWSERDFEFPVRMLRVNAPEMSEPGGQRSKDWLKTQIEGKKIWINVDPKNRVGKYGRLLGEFILGGVDLNDMAVQMGYAQELSSAECGALPDLDKLLRGEFKVSNENAV